MITLDLMHNYFRDNSIYFYIIIFIIIELFLLSGKFNSFFYLRDFGDFFLANLIIILITLFIVFFGGMIVIYSIHLILHLIPYIKDIIKCVGVITLFIVFKHCLYQIYKKINIGEEK